MFNVEVGLYDANTFDRGIFGSTLKIYVSNAEASTGVICWSSIKWSYFWQYSVYCPTCKGRIGKGDGPTQICYPGGGGGGNGCDDPNGCDDIEPV